MKTGGKAVTAAGSRNTAPTSSFDLAKKLERHFSSIPVALMLLVVAFTSHFVGGASSLSSLGTAKVLKETCRRLSLLRPGATEESHGVCRDAPIPKQDRKGSIFKMFPAC